jgi:hypothetical protein
VWESGSPGLPGVGGEVDEAIGVVPPAALAGSCPGSETGAPLTIESRASAMVTVVAWTGRLPGRGGRTPDALGAVDRSGGAGPVADEVGRSGEGLDGPDARVAVCRGRRQEVLRQLLGPSQAAGTEVTLIVCQIRRSGV